MKSFIKKIISVTSSILLIWSFVACTVNAVSSSEKDASLDSSEDESKPVMITLNPTDYRIIGRQVSVDLCEWTFDKEKNDYVFIRWVIGTGSSNIRKHDSISKDISSMLNKEYFYSLHVEEVDSPQKFYTSKNVRSKLIISDDIPYIRKDDNIFFPMLKHGYNYKFTTVDYIQNPEPGVSNFIVSVTMEKLDDNE